MNLLVKLTDQSKIEELRQQFQKIDTDGTGSISKEELRNAIKESNMKIPEKEVEDIIKQVDYFGN